MSFSSDGEGGEVDDLEGAAATELLAAGLRCRLSSWSSSPSPSDPRSRYLSTLALYEEAGVAAAANIRLFERLAARYPELRGARRAALRSKLDALLRLRRDDVALVEARMESMWGELRALSRQLESNK